MIACIVTEVLCYKASMNIPVHTGGTFGARPEALFEFETSQGAADKQKELAHLPVHTFKQMASLHNYT